MDRNTRKQLNDLRFQDGNARLEALNYILGDAGRSQIWDAALVTSERSQGVVARRL